MRKGRCLVHIYPLHVIHTGLTLYTKQYNMNKNIDLKNTYLLITSHCHIKSSKYV